MSENMEKKKKPFVSVIIPVYNVEKYLSQCLDSVVSQTLENIEIIIVNDGSTDGSLKIINDYAEKDDRIIVVNQTNGGYAKAVNKGLSLASGEYVAEIDSDDYINKNMYQKLYDIACKNDIDIVVGRYAEFIGKDLTFKMFPKSFVPDGYQNVKLYTKNIYEENKLELLGFTAIWSAIYKRSLIVNNKITLNENVRCYNDNGFWFRTRAVASTIYYDDEIMYFYRVDVAGQTIKKMNERYPLLIDEFVDIKNQYIKMGIWKQNANFWFRHFVNNVLYFVMPKIEVKTMYYFAEAVKPIILSFEKKEKLLVGTLDKFAESMIKILTDEGEDAFVAEYVKNKYKVSVVMSVYNGAKYLDKTIPQILNQTLKDIEFIVVNDGSTDSSLSIIQNYQYDFRLKIINLEENKGQSYARNIGVKNAVGEYVIFLDCDDDFDKELCGKLYWHMNRYKLDLCLTGYTVHNCKTDGEYKNLFWDFPDDVFEGISLNSCRFNQIVGWNWDKMYRREFILKNKLFFPEDMHISEDALVAYPAVLCAQRMFVLKESLITYKEFGANSVSSKMDKYVADNFKYYDKMYAFLKEHNLEKTHEKHFINLFVGHSMFAFEYLLKTEKAKQEFFDLLVGVYIKKYRVSKDIATFYFDNEKIAERYKTLRRMMKYKPGEYDLFVSDLAKIPLEVDDYKYGYDFKSENIVVINTERAREYGKWIFAFESKDKNSKVNWVNFLSFYLLNKKYQDNYISLTVTLLKNNSFFIADTLNISVTANGNDDYEVHMFDWEKKNKLSEWIGYALCDGCLRLYAKFSGAFDGFSVKVNLVESRDNDVATSEFLDKKFLSVNDLVEEPENIVFAGLEKKKKNKKKKKGSSLSIIRFLLKPDNRRILMNKLMLYVKE